MKVIVGRWQDELPKIPARSVNLILSDPPYVNSKHAWDEETDWADWWAQARRVLAPGAAVALFSQGLPSARVMLSNPKEYRYSWVWEKTSATGAMNARHQPLRAHEDILVFRGRGSATYRPQMVPGAVRRPTGYPTTHRFYHDGKHVPEDPGGRRTVLADARYPRSVLRFPRVSPAVALVPNQKPVPLLRYLIRTYTYSGQTVLDCWAGSGSTLVAAQMDGRNWVGIEQDRDRALIARNRTLPGSVWDSKHSTAEPMPLGVGCE